MVIMVITLQEHALDHKIKETGIRICEKGGSSLKVVLPDVYSNVICNDCWR